MSSESMSGPEQGQNRAVGRSQDNASTIESTAVTVSTFLQGVARSLLPGGETGVAFALLRNVSRSVITAICEIRH